MASANETTFGASIVPIEDRATTRTTQAPATLDSPSITPTASHESLRASDDHIRSAASAPNRSREPLTTLPTTHSHPTTARTTTAAVVNEKDLEAGPVIVDAAAAAAGTDEHPFTSKVSVDYNKECRMWPSKQTLLQTRMAEKKRQRAHKLCGGCGPVKDGWARFTPRQKLMFKILAALLVVGIAVAIGVGISVAVNGTVYVSDNHSQQIPPVQSR